jgi:hypothetical protein
MQPDRMINRDGLFRRFRDELYSNRYGKFSPAGFCYLEWGFVDVCWSDSVRWCKCDEQLCVDASWT